MLGKKLENRITIRDLVDACGITTIYEQYHYSCGHTEDEEMEICFAHHQTIDEFDFFEIDEPSHTLILHINMSSNLVCDRCEWGYDDRNMFEERIYCSDMPRPEGFENVVIYHGLAAYSGTHTADKAIENAIDFINHPEWEVCCATRAIGPIGFVVTGTVITASNVDLCSSIDMNNGKRFFVVSDYDDRATDGIIHYASQLEKQWDHDEIITRDNTAAAVWIKDWAIQEFKEQADKLCAMYNLPLIVIETEEEYDDGK